MRRLRLTFYVCLAFFAGLLALHTHTVAAEVDLALLQMVQSYTGSLLDDLAIFMAVIGGPFVSMLGIGALSLVFIRRRRIRAMFLFWALFVLLTGFEVVAKVKVVHPRPAEEFRRKISPTILFRIIPDVTVPGDNSFPSGHCLRAVYLMGILVLLARSRYRGANIVTASAAIAFVLAACWSRLYLGVHWPSDVLAGCLLGAMGLLIYARVQQV